VGRYSPRKPGCNGAVQNVQISVKTVSKNNKTRGLTPWKPGQTGNPEGRPKKLINDIMDSLKERGFQPTSKIDVQETFRTLLNLSEAELRALVADEDSPMLIKVVGREILSSSNGFRAIVESIDRAHGKASSDDTLTIRAQTEKEIVESDAAARAIVEQFRKQ